MPRSKRIDIVGGVYHVIVRGIERKGIFKDDTDRKEFLSRFANSLYKTKSKCFAWVLMSNHIHLMLRTGINSLSDVMRGLLTGYAIFFNKRHKRHGYLYQNRYKSVLCQEDIYFRELVRYIHLNPARAQIVNDINGLDNYLWCGHSTVIGKHKNKWQDVDGVLVWFGQKRNEAIEGYKEFIERGIGEKPAIDFSGGGLIRSVGGWSNLTHLRKSDKYQKADERILGDDEFVNKVLREAEEKIDRQELLIRQGWNLEKLAERVCGIFDISVSDLQKKGKANAISQAKMLFCYWGHNELGASGKQVGEYLGISRPAVCKNIVKGAELKERKHRLIN
jgi:REP element-mobilizing transposase RayT